MKMRQIFRHLEDLLARHLSSDVCPKKTTKLNSRCGFIFVKASTFDASDWLPYHAQRPQEKKVKPISLQIRYP